jgi:hypothetical protein
MRTTRGSQFLALAFAGTLCMLGGLAWEAFRHAQHQAAEHEEIFTLSNPAHAVLALGIALVAVGVIGATALSLSSRARPVILVAGIGMALLAVAASGWAAARESHEAGHAAALSSAAVPHVHQAAVPALAGTGPLRSPAATSPPRGIATPGPYSTRIADSGFEFHIAVIAGSTVTWTNNGATAHTVTDDDGGFDSGPLQPGESFTVDFDHAGVWNYACRIHPQMRGLVHVEEPTRPATDQSAGEARGRDVGTQPGSHGRRSPCCSGSLRMH